MQAEGTPARVLFVGRDPGEQEDKSGRPFVGDAGKKLRDTLDLFNLLPHSGFTNLVHCHTPKNRGPKQLEVFACRIWLQGEIWGNKPELIVALGQESLEGILNPPVPDPANKRTGFSGYRPTKPMHPIGDWHGKIVGTYLGVPVMAAYHPSAALRNGKLRRGFVADMRAVAERMGTSGKRPTEHWRLVTTPSSYCWAEGGTIAVDIETDPQQNILGVGFAFRDQCEGVVTAHYIPWGESWVVEVLQRIFAERFLVCHQAKFDIPILQAHGVHVDESRVHDTMLMAYVLRREKECGSLGLKELAAYDLGLSWPTLEEIGPPEDAPPEVLAEYCCQDAAATLMLWELYEAELKERFS